MSEYSNYRYVDNNHFSQRIYRLAWNLTYIVFFRYTPSFILHKWRVFLLKLFGARIGIGCKISSSVRVWLPFNLELGDYVALDSDVFIYNVDTISIGSKSAISFNSCLCTGTHNIKSLLRPLASSPINIGNHVWICSYVFIMPGVNISDGSVVGACSCLSKDTQPWSIYAGNPALFKKFRSLT